MFGINGSEFVILLLVAVVVVGPERMPRYAEQLGGWVRTLRTFLRTAKARVDEEVGDQMGDVDWTALDPRRYDPRRIVREALFDDLPASPADQAGRTYTSRPLSDVAGATAAADPTSGDVARAPFDDEAT